MIAKIVPKKKSTGSFKGLTDYIEDRLGLHSEKVELVYSENCEFDTIEENVREVKAVQALSESKADPNVHIVVSFQEDERPTPEQLKIITHELLKSMGMEHHQRVCATHIDTNNYHLHIAVNRIDPDTHKRARMPFSKLKINKKAAELEEKLGLKKDNHIPNWQLAEQNRKSNNINIQNEKELNYGRRDDTRADYDRRAGDERGRYTREQRAVSIHQSNTPKSNKRAKTTKQSELRDLSSIEMVHDIERTQVLLQGDDDYQLDQKRESDNPMRRERTSDNSNDGSDEPSVNRQADDIKSHTGVSNLLEWIKTEANNDIKAILSDDNSTLDDLHTTLAKFNLELKERGNGLIIKDKSRNLFCKASDIDRNLSRAKLESKFGKFEAMEINIKPTIQFGTPKNDYWDNYKSLMDLNYKSKKDENAKLKEQYTKDRELIKSKWKANINKVKASTWHKTLKRETYAKIFENQKKELDELYKKYSLERNEISKDKKHVTYKDYLIQEALKGDEEALAMIRKQKQSPAPKEEDNIVGGRTSNRLFVAHNPLITKLGYVVYKLDKKDDKSKIIDKGNHLKLSNMSDEALAEGLKMAISKYGKDLNITGDDLFKQKIIEAARLSNIDVKFKDENMNKTLEALKAQKEVTANKNAAKDFGRE